MQSLRIIGMSWRIRAIRLLLSLILAAISAGCGLIVYRGMNDIVTPAGAIGIAVVAGVFSLGGAALSACEAIVGRKL